MSRIRIRWIAGAALVALAAGGTAPRHTTADRTPPATPPAAAKALISAPGRVEPVSEEISIGSELSGKLHSVPVAEGDRVEAGQVLATLENRDYQAALETARANLMEREAELRRVIDGAREQERREAGAGVHEAEAILENARLEDARREDLLRKGAISREESERAARALAVAQARYQAAAERRALIDAPAREEDRSRAEALVAAARSAVAQAEAVLAKTFIRAPIGAVVLRKYRNAGENVGTGPGDPIVALGDVSRLRVRADIDEADIAALCAGQRAYVTAGAYGDRKFYGRVYRVGQALGRKNVHTDEPAERLDAKILETLIDLDHGQHLPPNLRVDVFIETGGTADAQ